MPIVMNGSSGNSRGFTLVEMSIVLVIIGLIIGGILKGQEIIASARQKAVINQVNAVRAAANTYFDRYRALPGDDPQGSKIDSNVGDGDGSGIIGTGSAIDTDVGNAGEEYNFFNGLIAANLLNGGQLTASNTTVTGFGKQALPASPITGAGLTILHGQASGTGTGSAKTSHWVRLHKGFGAPKNALSPRTMANIDTQTDDGQPGNGGVRAVIQNGGTGTCDSSGAYNASDDILCIGVFEVTQ